MLSYAPLLGRFRRGIAVAAANFMTAVVHLYIHLHVLTVRELCFSCAANFGHYGDKYSRSLGPG